MKPDTAMIVLKGHIEDYEQERAMTRAVLAALPDSGAGYKPDPKSRTALQLAFHIAYYDMWFLESIAAVAFLPEKEEMPEGASKPSDIPAWYDKVTAEGLEKVKKLNGEQAATVLDFFGIKMANAAFMSFLLKHMIHHRGQLAAYLRPAGGMVPPIYGGSADVPFAPPAG